MPGRIKRAAIHADETLSGADAQIAKAGIILDELADLLDNIRDGVEIELNIAGKKFPATLRIKP